MNSKNKFISMFVNEMYAIIIGIGIGHILFVQQLNLKNLNDMVMVLFVTTIVLTYWWDWSEYIEADVQTSKREFAIDFFILIFLESLFAYYNNPAQLAIILFILAVLDLIWMINFVWESNKESRNSIIKAKTWLKEKILVILVYACTWSIFYVFKDNLYFYLQTAIIIISFTTARYIGFRYLKKAKNLIFRPAAPSDIQAIVKINNQYTELGNNADNHGLLLKKLDMENVENSIAANTNRYFVAQTSDSVINGFIEIADHFADNLLEHIQWEDEIMRDIVLSDRTIYIEQVAVDKNFQSQGVASYLYHSIFEMFPDTVFTAFVINRPIKNTSSISFHKKQGFKKAAYFESKQFLGMTNYESILFVKSE